MKFKRGQLVKLKAGQLATVTSYDYNNAACIVLEHMREGWASSILYKVYVIEDQRTIPCFPDTLSPINPQESESEV